MTKGAWFAALLMVGLCSSVGSQARAQGALSGYCGGQYGAKWHALAVQQRDLRKGYKLTHEDCSGAVYDARWQYPQATPQMPAMYPRILHVELATVYHPMRHQSYIDEAYKPDGYSIDWRYCSNLRLGKAGNESVSYQCLDGPAFFWFRRGDFIVDIDMAWTPWKAVRQSLSVLAHYVDWRIQHYGCASGANCHS